MVPFAGAGLDATMGAMRSPLPGIALALLLAGAPAACVVYDYPTTVMRPASYDRSWNAAILAMQDQGVRIAREDRGAGMIEGRRGDNPVNAHIVSQADGAVRVEFNVGGDLSADPSLPDRISRSYDARMGR